jgi:hypothetical protein
MQIDCHVNADGYVYDMDRSVFADPNKEDSCEYTMFETKLPEDDTFEDDSISTDVEEAPDFPGLDFLCSLRTLCDEDVIAVHAFKTMNYWINELQYEEVHIEVDLDFPTGEVIEGTFGDLHYKMVAMMVKETLRSGPAIRVISMPC